MQMQTESPALHMSTIRERWNNRPEFVAAVEHRAGDASTLEQFRDALSRDPITFHVGQSRVAFKVDQSLRLAWGNEAFWRYSLQCRFRDVHGYLCLV